MLALYALQSLASFYRNYWAGLAGNKLIFDLQCRLFSHLQILPHSFFDKNPSGAIVSRVLYDVQQANELVGSALIDIWMDAISLTLVVAALLSLNWHLALVALCISPLWVAFMRFFAPRIKSVSHRMQETVAEISGEVHERVVGASTIKSFCREDHEVEQFRGQTERLLERTIDKVRLAARQEMLVQLLTRAAPTVVIWVGALMIIRGTMTLGTMVAMCATTHSSRCASTWRWSRRTRFCSAPVSGTTCAMRVPKRPTKCCCGPWRWPACESSSRACLKVSMR